jgi:hypothetical protein
VAAPAGYYARHRPVRHPPLQHRRQPDHARRAGLHRRTADNYLRAIDENTGEAVGKTRLPAGGQATPMSYAVMAMADWTPPAATT